MSEPNPNRLIVEDRDIEGVIVGLMRYHLDMPWGNTEKEWPVHIEGRTGKADVFKQLPVAFKGSGIKRIGVVVDADSDLRVTWDQIAGLCRRLNGQPPTDCPREGLVIPIADKRFGAWIMPNNESVGMVEHFCNRLIPAEAADLWQFAGECVAAAKTRGACFPELYTQKAHIHTWLSWQQTPGQRMGIAIKEKALIHSSPEAIAFATWFTKLFELPRWSVQ